jgi:hypothetical protein
MTKRIFTLTGGINPVFAWRLPREIAAYKQPRLPAQQWAHIIKGLAQKGVKGVEIEDSKVLPWLEEQGKQQLTREVVAEFVSFSLPSIKETRLSGSDAAYRNYSWVSAGDDYNESLFYFPTVTEDYSDRIADLDEAISALNFDFDALGQDPEAVFRLDSKREDLLRKQKLAQTSAGRTGGPSTHFSSRLQEICPDARADFAHMRWSVMDFDGAKTLFLHEMQSDWAQRGRKAEWTGKYKKAPLVTETEHWTGFLLRRAMSLAVENNCTHLSWINGKHMVNGGKAHGSDGLDEFYLRIVPSIAKKLAKPFQSELALKDVILKGASQRLAVMPVTAQMKSSFSNVPVYSYARVVKDASFDLVRSAQMQKALQLHADRMFGPEHAMRVRVVSAILNACDSHEPAGALLGRVAKIAFGAGDPVSALNHEAFHFANHYHFDVRQREAIARQFAPGSPLLLRTTRVLMSQGEVAAAQQCAGNPEEAAAHAFALWKNGHLSLAKLTKLAGSEESRRGITNVLSKWFPEAEAFVRSICQWMRQTASPTDFVARIVRAHGALAVTPPNADITDAELPPSTSMTETDDDIHYDHQTI